MRCFALLASLAVLVGGCSIDDGSGEASRPEPSPTTTTTRSPSPTTTADTFDSVGIVEIAGETHEIEADCHAPGAGEVLAIGLATPDDGRRIEVYLQAFLGEPYLAIAVTPAAGGETVTYEAAVDRPLEIVYDADILRVDDAALVTDLDLETGEGTDAGIGSVVVECRAYEDELPPGFTGG